jgi:hypothetical protein
VWKAGRVSEEFRLDCWARAKSDHTWFVDTFGWTENAKEHPDNPYRPFVLRDYQEDLAALLIKSVGKHDVAIPKARDMGATWTALTVVEWLWQFYDYQRVHMGSSKQELVDKIGDPRSLFWKLDFFYRMLPIWLRPLLRADDRKLNSFINPSTESTVTGEATNPNFGRAARPGVALLDEFAAVEDGYAVLSATRDSTKTRWFISTYQGAFGAFYERVEKMREHTPEYVFEIPWFKHPQKSIGLYRSHAVRDGERERWELEIIDKSFPWTLDDAGNPIGYVYEGHSRGFVFDGKQRSPWFDEQCIRSGSPQEIAQELEMQAQEAGWQFMTNGICEGVSRKHARPPLMRGNLRYTNPLTGELRWEEDPDGLVQLWCSLTTQERYSGVNDVVVGCDISTGTNAEGSNSVACFYDCITREKIAQLTAAGLITHKFAWYVVALCRFFTGPAGPALLNWETDGPGETFKHEVIEELGYRRVWMRRDLDAIDAEASNKPGWKSSASGKKILLQNYRTALLEDRFINRCHEAIMECTEFVMTKRNTYEHTTAMSTQDRNGQGDLHGDMVIADALAYLALSDMPTELETPKPEIPKDSYAGRRLEKSNRRNNKPSW